MAPETATIAPVTSEVSASSQASWRPVSTPRLEAASSPSEMTSRTPERWTRTAMPARTAAATTGSVAQFAAPNPPMVQNRTVLAASALGAK